MSAAPRFDVAEVRRYYDRHTSAFVAFGRGGRIGAIHRAVWGPGADTRPQAFHYVDDQIADIIRQLPTAPDPPHIVDLGCGVGASLCYLAERLPFRGTGITLSPVQARLAAERIQEAGLSDRLTCLEGDYGDLPSTMPPADLAYAIESFAHAADPARFFAQCGRLVRPGGVVVICDDFRRPHAGPRAARTIDRFCRGWHLNALLEPDELHALAQAAGFAHESTLDLSPYLERRRTRDRLLDALLGWLPLDRTPLGPVLGGTALLKCLERGWTGYELAVFRRRG
jgi:tocopherol O-methyltransferase